MRKHKLIVERTKSIGAYSGVYKEWELSLCYRVHCCYAGRPEPNTVHYHVIRSYRDHAYYLCFV